MRFIEYMDVGNSNSWTSAKLVAKKEIIETIHARYPLREIGRDQGSAPSVDYEFVDGQGDIGVIASVTEPFCSSCTSENYGGRQVGDVPVLPGGPRRQGLLRSGASDEEILKLLSLDMDEAD